MMKTRKGHNVYPITVAQKFHLYYAKYCPNMAVLNIGTSLTIGTELDWNVLKGFNQLRVCQKRGHAYPFYKG